MSFRLKLNIFSLALLLASMLVTVPTFGQNVEYVSSTLWSSVVDVTVAGEYAYCAFTDGLAVFDISGEEPVPISQFYCSGGGRSVFISGALAYLADGDAGLQIIDISDPINPICAGFFDTPDFARDVFVDANMAFIADGYSGLEIIDVADPSNPTLLGSLASSGYARGIYAEGNYAYLASDTSGLQVIDISDASDPILVGTCETPDASFSVVVSGIYAYVADYHSGLQIIDISDPTDPTIVGSYNTPGLCNRIRKVGDYAYIADLGSLEIIDVSDPENPVLTGSYDTPSFSSGISVAEQLAYVADRDVLVVIDVSDPSNPSLDSYYNVSGWTRAIYTVGDYAYAPSDGSFRTVDIHDPAAPALLGSCDLPDNGSSFDVYAVGHYAYVAASSNGLQIIDISTPSGPQWVAGLDTLLLARDLHVDNDRAYVAGMGGLTIIDVSDPSVPILLGSFEGPDDLSTSDVFVRGNYAYVANGSSGLLIVNVENPSAPYLEGSYDSPGSAGGVYVNEDYAYLAAGQGGLQIVDVSDPANPFLVGTFDQGNLAVTLVQAAGGFAFIGGGAFGLQIINIEDPSNPSLVAEYHTPGTLNNLYVANNYIYLADWFSLIILRFIPTAIDEEIILPQTFEVAQNYPNPFNAYTRISFDLSRPSVVTVDIFDLGGRKVANLLNRQMLSGSHSVIWNARDIASGVYFYRLQAEGFRDTRKMVLIK